MESLRILRSVLFERFAVAKQDGNDATIAMVHRELCRNLSEAARFGGLYAPEKHDVAVSVSSIEDTRRRLLAIAERADADRAALPVIDGEVVPGLQA